MANLKKEDAIAVYYRRTGATYPLSLSDEELYAWLAAKGYEWHETEYAWKRVRTPTAVKHNLYPVRTAIRRKDKARARELLRPILADNPNADAWVLAAYAAPTRVQAMIYLNKALEEDPFHKQAAGALLQLQQTNSRTERKAKFRMLAPKVKPDTTKQAKSSYSRPTKAPKRKKFCPQCGSHNIVSVREQKLQGCAFGSAGCFPLMFLFVLSIAIEFVSGDFPPANLYECVNCGAQFTIN